MEIVSHFSTMDEPIELPPGFRFHPSDEELITHYLSPKLIDTTFETKAIGEVDLNKVEPWDLPWLAKMGEKEWYFFCVKDRKYPTGSRTNRATKAGYWKATGKDKDIYRGKNLVGMKKTLVFYGGRAPRGEKTNWVMHEYRMEGKHGMHQNPSKTSRNEWVICRVFKKSTGGKKVHISGLIKGQNCDSQLSDLPPLMELSSDENPRNHNNTTAEGSNVTFSNQMEDPRDKYIEEFSSCSTKNEFSSFPFMMPKDTTPNSSFSSQLITYTDNSFYRDSAPLQDQSFFRYLLENNGKQITKPEFSEDMIMKANMSPVMFNQDMGFRSCEDQELQFIATGPVDLDCL